MLSQARSRSKGPLSDQVADAPYPRGQCRSWVDKRHLGFYLARYYRIRLRRVRG
jgi:hypothetical protein